MPPINPMPHLIFNPTTLAIFGSTWLGTTSVSAKNKIKAPNCFDRKQGMQFGETFIDPAFAAALSVMLGKIPVISIPKPTPTKPGPLNPPQPDCVEVGPTRIIGGVRPQYFDAVYRPDGLRIAYDSKTLNDTYSIKKNWQNMVNDLATEATTVHTRFPYALVVFIIFIPKPALTPTQQKDIITTLERISGRRSPEDAKHLAEAISLVIWDPATGSIDKTVPGSGSKLDISTLPQTIYSIYSERYKGLPPH